MGGGRGLGGVETADQNVAAPSASRRELATLSERRRLQLLECTVQGDSHAGGTTSNVWELLAELASRLPRDPVIISQQLEKQSSLQNSTVSFPHHSTALNGFAPSPNQRASSCRMVCHPLRIRTSLNLRDSQPFHL